MENVFPKRDEKPNIENLLENSNFRPVQKSDNAEPWFVWINIKYSSKGALLIHAC